MDAATLAKLVGKANCRVFGWEDATNEPQRNVLAVLIHGFDHKDATILCEPSLARKTTRPPDARLIDPIAGVHLIEVKGFALDQIEAIEPGGLLKVRYFGGSDTKTPVAQVRKAMFDIKNAAEQASPSDLTLHFKYWVVLPSISRASWFGRWGSDAYAPPEFLFSDDLTLLADKIRADGQRHLANKGLSQWPADQFAYLWRAFGDSSLEGVHVAKDNQDRRLRQRGCLTLSTVASAKGYDAYCTLLVASNDFNADLKGRASFYVGCTRAIEYLEVFAHERTGLVLEFERALRKFSEV